MCDFNNGFILCKCEDDLSTDKTEGTEYIWTLYSYMGLNTDRKMGRYVQPVSTIGKGLSATFVQEKLNSDNCFDFDYQPIEGDNLSIEEVGTSNRIEFIFKENQWKEDHYSPFSHNCKKTNNGILKSN